MDWGSHLHDSGLETSSSANYTETPTSSNVVTVSRKRKISQLYGKASLDFGESPAVFGDHPNLLSSTLNESLTRSLERCNLIDGTPSGRASKKYKSNDSPEYLPKTRSAPSTPTKHFDIDDSSVLEKSLSEDLEDYASGPERSRNAYSNRAARLGSPERLQLLYPVLKPTPSPPKLKTPEKLREFIKRINSPAKKRLFGSLNNKEHRRPYSKVDTDPVSVFLVKNDFRHIVSKIFGYLPDRDLCAVVRVSKSWKKALMSDSRAYPRYYQCSQVFHFNKENYTPTSAYQLKLSPPGSPEQDSFARCTRLASQLLPSQSLRKCPRCTKPAVIEKSIGQCQNLNCGYIYCVNCLSFSTDGPEGFVDKCNNSELVLETKRRPFGLQDLSNMERELPSFLSGGSNSGGGSASYSFMSQSRHDSSGYQSEVDSSPIIRKRFSLNSVDFNILQNYNKQSETSSRLKKRRSSMLTAVTSSSTPKIVEIMEPSSPPKIKLVACSKQSKKNLRRLQF